VSKLSQFWQDLKSKIVLRIPLRYHFGVVLPGKVDVRVLDVARGIVTFISDGVNELISSILSFTETVNFPWKFEPYIKTVVSSLSLSRFNIILVIYVLVVSFGFCKSISWLLQ
jgi:hypothetical protein